MKYGDVSNQLAQSFRGIPNLMLALSYQINLFSSYKGMKMWVTKSTLWLIKQESAFVYYAIF